jgi:hypothetical protein
MLQRCTWMVRLVPSGVVLFACSNSNDSSATSDGGAADSPAAYEAAMVPVTDLNDASTSTSTAEGGIVTCSGKTCAAPNGVVPLVACCLSDNTCGLTFDLSQFGGVSIPGIPEGGIGCQDPNPGTPDPSCPTATVMGYMLAGCCTRAGVCGYDLSMPTMGALGCNAQPLGTGMGGSPTNAQPQPCGGTARDGRMPDPTGAPTDASSSPKDGSSPDAGSSLWDGSPQDGSLPEASSSLQDGASSAADAAHE